MNSLIQIVSLLYLFLRNTLGIVNSPYTTYRRMVTGKKETGTIVYIFLLVVSYFLFAPLVRGVKASPFLLSFRFNTLFFAFLIGFFGMILTIYFIGKLFQTQVDIKTILFLWSYSLIPTIVWFFITSFLFILVPPPRTYSIWGKMLSLVFVSFSIAIFIWKFILYYLTLRFGLKFDLIKIIIATFIIIPLLGLYSFTMYKIHVFRVPFI